MAKKLIWSGLFAALLTASPAFAFVVQSTNPLTYHNVARDGVIPPPTYNGAPPKAKKNRKIDDKVNYQAIAAKLLPSRPEYLSLELIERTYQTIKIPEDFLVRVMLPQTAGTYWRIETNEKIIKPLSTQEVDEDDHKGVRSFEFLSEKRGHTRIYLDNYDRKSNHAIQSRIIRVIVN